MAKQTDFKNIKLASGNTKYIQDNLKYMEFILKNKCKVKKDESNGEK